MQHGIIAIVCMALLQACAQTSTTKALGFARFSNFDGDWYGVMKKTVAVQTFSTMKFDCDEISEVFFLRVQNGVVSGYLEADENYSFRTRMSSDGAFKAVIPLNSFYRYKKDTTLDPASIALLLYGDLSAESGRFVIGDSRMSLNGCSTDVDYIAL